MTALTDWDALFAAVPTTPAAPPARRLTPLEQMHQVHGVTPGQRCGDCAFLLTTYLGYFKCERFRLTHGPGTDWRKKWQACGLFQATEGESDP